MIRRIFNAYTLEVAKYSRQAITFVGPILVVLLILVTPVGYPLEKDGTSDYAFMAYALGMTLNLFGFLMILIYSTSLISSEMGSGTIRLLLVRPLRRREFLAAKMLNGMSYAFVLSLAASLTVWILAYILGDLTGVEYGGRLIYTNSEMVATFLIAGSLNLLPQMAAAAFGIMVSTFTKNTATAMGIAVGSWLVLDFVKYPLNIAPFLFSSYLEKTWGVYQDRADAFEAPFFPDAYYGIATSCISIAVFLSVAMYILSRRNLGS